MQVILDSSFARPGSAPIWGGKKVEYRDWTRSQPKLATEDSCCACPKSPLHGSEAQTNNLQSVGCPRLLCQSQYLEFLHDSDGRSAIPVSDASGRCDCNRCNLDAPGKNQLASFVP